MPLLSSLTRFTKFHPIMTGLGMAGAGATLGSLVGGKTEEERKRRMLLGGLGGAATSLLIPGVRSSAIRALQRQAFAIAKRTPGKVTATKELEQSLEALAKGNVKNTPKFFKGLGNLTKEEKTFLSLLPHSHQANPAEVARALAEYRAGLSTLPDIVKQLRHPAQYARKWWTYTSPTQKALLLGLTGYSGYKAIKGEGSPGDVASNIAWMASGATPIGVWYPMSTIAEKGVNALGRLVSGKNEPIKSRIE